MSRRIPSFTEALSVSRSHGRLSEAPGLWNGLTGHWPIMEGGGLTVHDLSGYSQCGALDSGEDWVTGERGHAMSFDGVNKAGAGVVMQKDKSSASPADECLGVWFRATNTSQTSGAIFGYLDEFFWDQYGRGFWYDQGDVYCISEANHSNAALTVSANDTNWHFVCANFGASGELFFDGQSISVGTLDGAWTYWLQIGSGGSYATPPEGKGTFEGEINLAVRYGRHLTLAEVQAHWRDPWAMCRQRVRYFPAAAVAPGFGGVNQIIGGGIVA